MIGIGKARPEILNPSHESRQAGCPTSAERSYVDRTRYTGGTSDDCSSVRAAAQGLSSTDRTRLGSPIDSNRQRLTTRLADECRSSDLDASRHHVGNRPPRHMGLGPDAFGDQDRTSAGAQQMVRNRTEHKAAEIAQAAGANYDHVSLPGLGNFGHCLRHRA